MSQAGSRLQRALPWLLFAGALALRLVALGRRSLWSDEAYSWWFGTLGEAIWGDLGDPHHPPLYYTILSWIIPISDSEFALRLPSALASALAVPVTYLAGRKLTGDWRVGTLAAVLLALSPIDVWYAQEARHAALGTFLVTLAMYGLIRSDVPGRILGALALAAAFFTYYVTTGVWAMILGVGAFIHWRRRGRFFLDWLIVSVPAIAVFVAVQGPEFVAGFASIMAIQDRPLINAVLSVGPGPVSVLLVAALGSFAVAALVRSALRSLPRAVAVAGLAAYAVCLAIPFLERGLSLQRVVVVAWPAAMLFLAYAAVSSLRWQTVRAAGVALASLALVASVASIVLVDKDDWRSATAYIEDHAGPDDAIWMVDHPRNWEGQPGEIHEAHWGSAPYVYYGADLPLLREDDEDRYDDLVAAVAGDVWVVGARSPRDPVPNPGGEAWLDANWELADEYAVHRRAVRRYTRP